jgi:hypothetical protein
MTSNLIGVVIEYHRGGIGVVLNSISMLMNVTGLITIIIVEKYKTLSL